MKKYTLHILVFVLIALQTYSLIKINSLQNEIEYTDRAISAAEDRMNNQINSIYQNVDQKLNEQASLIYHASVRTGKPDMDTLTVPVAFTVEPKTVTESMTVSLDFGGEIIQLEKSGLKYSGIKNFEISENIAPAVIIEENGVKRIENYEELQAVNIKEQIFPYLFARFSGESSYGSSEYYAKGKIEIDYKPAQENNSFADIKYVVRVDNEIIKQTEVPFEQKDGSGGNCEIDIDEKYSINAGQILTSSIVAVDSLGFTHEYLVTHFTAGSDAQREPYFENISITAPNGETVYQFDEFNYVSR